MNDRHVTMNDSTFAKRENRGPLYITTLVIESMHPHIYM